jgi:hypothetical protein
MDCLFRLGVLHIDARERSTRTIISLAVTAKSNIPRYARVGVPITSFKGWRLITYISNSFTVGAVYTISVVQIPQRVQTLNNLSPLQAGYRLLALVLGSPIGSGFTSVMAKKKLIPLTFILLLGAVLQVVGSVLMSTLPISASILAAQYGYEIILGFGLGMSIGALLLAVQEKVDVKYECMLTYSLPWHN